MRFVFVCAMLGHGLLAGPAFAAEQCPECPQGCIPQAYVESFKDTVGETARACPPGCVAIETVKALRDQPGCVPVETGQARAAPPAAGAQPNVNSTRTRGVFLPTALSAPAGELIFTGYGAGLWDAGYVLSDNLQLGAYMVLPVYVAGVFPNIKAQFALGDNLAVGFGGLAGLGGPYAGGEAGAFLLVAGGHAEVTVHTGKHLFNLGLMVLGAGLRQKGKDLDMVDGAILLPNAAYRFAFHPDWSFQVEVTGPVVVGKDGVVNEEAIVIATYGFRGHGDIMFGDVGFTLPLFSDYIKDVWKYTPLGIPYFSIGFKF